MAILKKEHHQLQALFTLEDSNRRAVKESLNCGEKRKETAAVSAGGRDLCCHSEPF